jgi:hypothetical protein
VETLKPRSFRLRLRSKETLSPKNNDALQYNFFYIHEMEAENWNPFTVSHRCRISTRKETPCQARSYLYPPVYTSLTKILCTQLCSTNEAISTLGEPLYPTVMEIWINMLRATALAGRWKIPKNSSLPWIATGDGGLKNWIEGHGRWHPLKWPTTRSFHLEV